MIKDKNKKLSLYEKTGVKYYLMADITKREIILYKLSNGRYQKERYTAGYEFLLADGCSVTPQLDDLWDDL